MAAAAAGEGLPLLLPAGAPARQLQLALPQRQAWRQQLLELGLPPRAWELPRRAQVAAAAAAAAGPLASRNLLSQMARAAAGLRQHQLPRV
jgi:hypothetical protein